MDGHVDGRIGASNLGLEEDGDGGDQPHLWKDTLGTYDDDDDDDDASSCSTLPGPAPMWITDQEREWARAIKEAVEQSAHSTPPTHSSGTSKCRQVSAISDMEYAQHGLVSKGDVTTPLHRIEHLRWFRGEYGIDDTPEQGVDFLRQMMNMQPGFLLRLDICPITGEGIMAGDHGAYYPSRALASSGQDGTAEQSWKIHARGQYYLLKALNPSLRSIREGVFAMMDASTLGWDNHNYTYSMRMHQELRSHYPMQFKKCMVYNTSSVSAQVYSLAKRFMASEFLKVVELGCQVQELDDTQNAAITLPELFLQPTREKAQEYLLERAGEILAMRAEHEQIFRI